MAILKAKTIKDTEMSELKSKIKELRLELIKLSAQRASKSVSNPGKIREIRKSVARIFTVMNLRKSEAKEGKIRGKAGSKKPEDKSKNIKTKKAK